METVRLIDGDGENRGVVPLAQALVGAAGPVSIDVPDHQAAFLTVLQGAGFEIEQVDSYYDKGAPKVVGANALGVARSG